MADHQVATGALPGLGAPLLVQVGQLLIQSGGVRRERRGVVLLDLAEAGGDRVGDGHHVQWVEPDVRIRGRFFAVLLTGSFPFVVILPFEQRDSLAHVHGLVGGDLCDGLVDRGLESLDVQDQVGFADLSDLLWGQLHIVGFRPRRGETGDGDVRAPHLLGGVLQRIERGHHRDRVGRVPARCVRPGVSCAAPGKGEAGETDDGNGD